MRKTVTSLNSDICKAVADLSNSGERVVGILRNAVEGASAEYTISIKDNDDLHIDFDVMAVDKGTLLRARDSLEEIIQLETLYVKSWEQTDRKLKLFTSLVSRQVHADTKMLYGGECEACQG